MNMYARIESGVVAEIFPPLFDEAGNLIPIDKRFHPDFVAQLVLYDPNSPPVPPEKERPPVEQRIALLRNAVQSHLDAVAAGLGYDDIRTAVTYADEPAVPKFQSEGQALRAWRSRVWAACYSLLEQWEAGAVEEPTPEQLIDVLPAFDANAMSPDGEQP